MAKFHNTKTSRNHKEASTSFKISNHGLCRQRENETSTHKEEEKNDELWNGNHGNNVTQTTGEDHGREEI